MWLARSRKSRLLQASLLLSVLTSVPALAHSADEINGTLIAQNGMDTATPGAQSSSSGAESTRQETSTGTEKPSSTPATTTQATTSTSSTSDTPSKGTTSASTSSTAPTNGPASTSGTSLTTSTANNTDPVQGPLLENRKLVLSRIQAAKKQGTGISGYMAEYGRIEQMVKNGEPEANYAERLSSLQSGIDEQLKRSQLLKTQHPTYSGISSSASSSSSVSSSASSGHSGGSSGGGGGGFGGMSIDQLKAKYGDKVPSSVADKLKSMSPEQQKELARKFLGN
jgi:hypothetical protein